LLLMLGLSRLMVHGGMIAALAGGAAGAGAAWPAVAAGVGVLGTFVTGSATASNILFAEFQAATAAALGMSALWLSAAQGLGAAIGNVVAPHNIIAGCATVGLARSEGAVLRRSAPVCAVYLVACGALLLWLTGTR
jgi:lactate permease